MPTSTPRPTVAALLTAAAGLLVGGCDPDPPVEPPEDPPAPAIATIAVEPAVALLAPVGATRALTALALDAGGQPIPGVAIAWYSDDEAVATVGATGTVTAAGAGTVRVRATGGGVAGQADIIVRESDGPPVVFQGGPVLTLDPVDRVEEAVVVVGNRIFVAGPADPLVDLAGPGAVRIDLGGRAVMPGFVDPHNHIYNAVYHGHSPDEVGGSYAEAEDLLVRAGTTTMANGNIWPAALEDFLRFVDDEGLRVRTSVYLGFNDVCGGMWPDDWYLAYPPVRDPEAMFRIAGIKFFGDGGVCNRGAFTFYADGGDLYFTTAELADAVERVQGLGYQALIHSLGDIASDSILAALERVFAGGGNVHRHRMDHNRYLRPDQLARYAEVGAIPVVFGSPFTCRIEDGGDWSFLADDRFAALRPRLDPWRALLDANPGHPIAWKSDTPIWPLQPMIHLWSLVTRDEQRADGTVCEAPAWLKAGAISVPEALEMMTLHAAHALWMDDAVGSLAPEKLADLIVLSESPLAVEPDRIREIQVLMTMIGGRIEFCAEDAGGVCPDSP